MEDLKNLKLAEDEKQQEDDKLKEAQDKSSEPEAEGVSAIQSKISPTHFLTHKTPIPFTIYPRSIYPNPNNV